MLYLNPNAKRSPYPSSLQRVMNIETARQTRTWLQGWTGLRSGPTPLYDMPMLAERLGIGQLALKDESVRSPLASFKALGAPAALIRYILRKYKDQGMDPAKVLRGPYASTLASETVISATDGNHGRALAAAARDAGCRCVIVLHAHVSEERERAIADFGAQIVRIDGNYDDSVNVAAEQAAQNGWQVISDTSYEGYETIPRDVMQGYGVIADEIFEQDSARGHEGYTHVFLQGGVGGLAAGIASYFWEKLGDKRPALYAVEPTQADCLQQSAMLGRAARATGSVDSIMAGLACGETSPLAWTFLESSIDAFITIEDHEAVAAMSALARCPDVPVVSGESGAAGLAGLCNILTQEIADDRLKIDGTSRILLINTEGATAPSVYRELTGEDADDVLQRQRDRLAGI